MGAWGSRAFDDDTANDWAYELEDVGDLSLVDSALTEVEEVGDDYVDGDVACCALAACEVLTRLRGKPGYCDAYTEKVDLWVSDHPLEVPSFLLERARRAVDRITSEGSELRELWEEAGAGEWRAGVEDLRRRLG